MLVRSRQTPTWWMLLSILLSLVLVLVQGAVTWSFDARRARLPAAVQWEDLNERLASIAVQVQERGDLLTEINQKIQDRDRIAAELAALVERRDNLHVEINSLAEAERQVELMKHRAAETAEAYAIERDKLESAHVELGRSEDDIAKARQRVVDLENDADHLRREIERLGRTLPAEVDEMKAARKRLEDEKSALGDEIASLRGERGALLAAREEVTALSVRKATLAQETEAQRQLLAEIKSDVALASFEEERATLIAEILRLQAVRATLESQIEQIQKVTATLNDLTARKVALEADIPRLERLERERVALSDEIADLRGERGALIAGREEVAALSVRKATLEQEAEAQRKLLDEINSDEALTSLRDERATIMAEVQRLQALHASHEQEIDQIQKLTAEVDDLIARKAALEEDNIRLRGEAPEPGNGSVVEDLMRRPECLPATPGPAHAPQQEADALHDVATHLKALGLKFDYRTIASFHTALKINESSQMTVLAGVSGTGKSLLPRRYAEAMGLHFLPIAVEPRWDSPQDLLGFYNYIEKRYRATELARVLVHMDPFNTSGLGLTGTPYADHVLLVLLDEMNLARVEYYFSEFLSRLELRPHWNDAGDCDKRAGASLPIDIRGRKEGPLQLFPSHNVLFAGTMNDDESTQSLSDKVLDRGNVMQFAAPGEFAEPNGNIAAAVTSGYRSHREWRSWIKSARQLIGGERDKVQRIINQLARIMESCGRPFGHRLNEAILTYVANYPRNPNDTVDNSLSDQIEFRILPKLRGLTIDGHQEQFGDLTKLIRDDLRDHPFAERLDNLVERQRGVSGQFNWRGLDRGQG